LGFDLEEGKRFVVEDRLELTTSLLNVWNEKLELGLGRSFDGVATRGKGKEGGNQSNVFLPDQSLASHEDLIVVAFRKRKRSKEEFEGEKKRGGGTNLHKLEFLFSSQFTEIHPTCRPSVA